VIQEERNVCMNGRKFWTNRLMPNAKQENPEQNVPFGGRMKRTDLSRCRVEQAGPGFCFLFLIWREQES
jgi:hypothetical protein